LRKWLDHQKLKRGGVPAASGGGKRK
jgi:hypothetical protein